MTSRRLFIQIARIASVHFSAPGSPSPQTSIPRTRRPWRWATSPMRRWQQRQFPKVRSWSELPSCQLYQGKAGDAKGQLRRLSVERLRGPVANLGKGAQLPVIWRRAVRATAFHRGRQFAGHPQLHDESPVWKFELERAWERFSRPLLIQINSTIDAPAYQRCSENRGDETSLAEGLTRSRRVPWRDVRVGRANST